MEEMILDFMAHMKARDARCLMEQLHSDYQHDLHLLRSCTTTHYPEGEALCDLAMMHAIATCKHRLEMEKSE